MTLKQAVRIVTGKEENPTPEEKKAAMKMWTQKLGDYVEKHPIVSDDIFTKRKDKQ